jgi:hypothetical protein
MPLLDDAKYLRNFALGDSVILRYFDARLKPDLEFAVRRLHMDVHSIFFEREEVEPVRSVAEDGGTHALIVALPYEALRGIDSAG